MSGDEETVSHVRQLLEADGIRCCYEGSVIYSIYVDRSKGGRALELLREEEAKGWQILIPDTVPNNIKRDP